MDFRVPIFLLCLSLASSYIIEPGPVVEATRGEVWPKPQAQIRYDGYFVVRPSLFRFKATGQDCTLLENAFQRYWETISRTAPKLITNKGRTPGWVFKADQKFLGYLDELQVYVAEPCDGTIYPFMNMDETYILNVTESSLRTNTIWGALRGLETFSQIIHKADDETTLVVNATHIHDFPRFSHRGLLIDTSRHFIPMYVLLQMVDAMAINKMNVFHWHITDDHSFPFQTIAFPELSEKGAFHPVSKIYTVADVANVIEYARLRGIRVIPEFDTPGHTRSWGVGIPELLTPCQGDLHGYFGPMDPSRDFVYKFLEEFLTEVKARFHDSYLHLGGDEVDFDCWESNADITSFMHAMNISGDYVALETYFIQKLVKIAENLKFKNVVWEEVFTNGVNFTNSTIVHIWKDVGWKPLMDKVTKAGYYSLLSSCWYLDHIAGGGDWKKYYVCEPLDFGGTPEQEKLVLGGEACMWAEAVNEYNIGSRIWPRASATAEKLWSVKNADTYEEAAKRLEEHTCRMNARGIPAQPPNGPGVCL